MLRKLYIVKSRSYMYTQEGPMAFKEKRTIVMIATGILILLAYCRQSFGRPVVETAIDVILKAQAITMLKFIGFGVLAMIVIQILFHILYSISLAVSSTMQKGSCDDKEIEEAIALEVIEDERDKIIELKSLRAGFFITGAGFIASLVWLVMDGSPTQVLNILFLSFGLGSILEGFTRLFYYSR